MAPFRPRPGNRYGTAWNTKEIPIRDLDFVCCCSWHPPKRQCLPQASAATSKSSSSSNST
eukprot:3992558-Heterocapsa_arctica.AAC.1